MRTTININDAILRDLRALAQARGRPFREIVEDTLALGLARQSKPTRRPRFKVKPHRRGLKPGFPGVSLNRLDDRLEWEGAAETR